MNPIPFYLATSQIAAPEALAGAIATEAWGANTPQALVQIGSAFVQAGVDRGNFLETVAVYQRALRLGDNAGRMRVLQQLVRLAEDHYKQIAGPLSLRALGMRRFATPQEAQAGLLAALGPPKGSPQRGELRVRAEGIAGMSAQEKKMPGTLTAAKREPPANDGGVQGGQQTKKGPIEGVDYQFLLDSFYAEYGTGNIPEKIRPLQKALQEAAQGRTGTFDSKPDFIRAVLKLLRSDGARASGEYLGEPSERTRHALTLHLFQLVALAKARTDILRRLFTEAEASFQLVALKNAQPLTGIGEMKQLPPEPAPAPGALSERDSLALLFRKAVESGSKEAVEKFLQAVEEMGEYQWRAEVLLHAYLENVNGNGDRSRLTEMAEKIFSSFSSSTDGLRLINAIAAMIARLREVRAR